MENLVKKKKNLQYVAIVKEFLDSTPKAPSIKVKIDKLIFIKIMM